MRNTEEAAFLVLKTDDHLGEDSGQFSYFDIDPVLLLYSTELAYKAGALSPPLQEVPRICYCWQCLERSLPLKSRALSLDGS